MSYNSKYTGSEVESLLDKVANGGMQCYIAQTTLYDLLYDEGLIALPQNDMQGILDALTQRKLVLFPDAYGIGTGTENNGYGVMLVGAAEDLLYFTVADTSGLVFAIEVNLDGTIVSRNEVGLTIYNTKTINGESLVGTGDIKSVYVMEDVMFTDFEEGFYVGQGEFDRIKEAILNGKQIAALDDRSTRGGYLYATQTNVLEQEDHINLTFVADDSVYQLSLYENGGLIDYYRIHTIGSSSGSSAMPLVDHGTGDTTFELTPNVFHKWGEVASLTLTLGAETADVANQYTFEFASGSTATVLALPDSLKWADDNVPTIEPNMIYQISILNGLAVVLKFVVEVPSVFPAYLTYSNQDRELGAAVYQELFAIAGTGSGTLDSGQLFFDDEEVRSFRYYDSAGSSYAGYIIKDTGMEYYILQSTGNIAYYFYD